ncbi:MAG: thrombospondin type 3 repeat-containing protein, partial [Gammaproteobacteria bacterium]|nr:thrombospondin type 3 repeat-containing protein [Gammaproteobacteria bacterium]
MGPISEASVFTLSCSGAGGNVSKTVSFSLLDNDSDSDGLPDDWELQYFGNLDQNAAGDYDGDGLSNGQEYGLGTNPANSDSDGDGASDAEEVVYGSDPNDNGDTWQSHRPYKPVVAAQDVAPLRDHVFDVAQAYGDPDGDALATSEWQVSTDAGFNDLMLYRGVFEATAVAAPLGVLLPSTQYWVRTRHRDTNGLPSEWSDAVQFSTAAAYPNDADDNGIDDDYQVDGFVDTNGNGISDPDEGMCNLYDAEGRNPIGFKSSAGTLQCFTSLGSSDLPQEQMPDGGLAYGAFSFMVTDLPVNAEAPAAITVTVYFPGTLDPGTGWYKYDEAIQDYTDFSSNVSVEGNAVTLFLADGGDGDQDGVVNGVIVDPSGPANTSVTSRSGGGAAGWLLFALCFAIALIRKRTVKSNTSAPVRWFQRSKVRTSSTAAVLLLATAVADAGVVTSYEVESTVSSAQSAVPLTFGQVFKVGDVPAGSDVFVRGGAGEPLLSQVDKKAFHSDGSLRHAIVTTVLPALSGSAQQTVSLETQAGGGSGAAVSLAGLLSSGFDAQVDLAVGGTVYGLSARELLSSGSYETWLAGPLVSEWIVGGPVRRADGTEHPRLAAYFHVRAYAGYDRVRVDVVIENGWAFVAGASDQSYNIDVRLNGASVYQQNINHYNHARWHRQFWAGQQPNAYVRHDVDYLQATGAIPSYIDLTPSEGYLNGLSQTSTPMDNGELTDSFGDTGAQPQIGPLPRWTSTYAVSGDRRAYRNMLANDDSAGTYAAHYRDKQTGRPVSIVDHPNATLQDNSVPQGSSSNPYTLDQAHQPSVGFLSYVVTGDYFYLEETQFWTSWNLLWTNSGYRGYEKGIFTVQVRGQAWALRNLGQAAYITPDDSPLKAHYASHIHHNAQDRINNYLNGSSANNLGAIKSYDGASLFAPWMDDFFSWAVGYLVDLGFTEVIPLRDWKVRFPVGRMGLTDYCYLRAAEYHLVIGPSNSQFWSSFAELYSQNFGAVGSCPEGAEMGGYAHSPTGYTSNLRPALVAA